MRAPTAAALLALGALALCSDAYRVRTVQRLNGREYVTVTEQPFFRVYHIPHYKVFRQGTPEALIESRSPVLLGRPPLIDAGLLQQRILALADAIRAGLVPLGLPGGQSLVHLGLFENSAHSVSSPGGLTLFGTPSATGGQKHDSGAHAAIGNASAPRRSTPRFGHHHLPAGESRQGASWPHWLRPYLGCMSLRCQCPLFNGTLERGAGGAGGVALCRLPSGRPLTKAIRKEYRTLTRDEREQFLYFLQKMKTSGLYNQFGLIHRKRGVHAGPGFFPWHREFLKRLEMAYRTLNSDQGLPYWDSTLDNNLPAPADSVMFSDALMGAAAADGAVRTGPFANWSTIDGRPAFERRIGAEADGELFNDARIDFVLNQTRVDRVLAFTLPLHTCINYELDDRFLEYSHDYAHYFIAGDMLERYSSSNDPLFFMHHGFVDSIWEQWRQQKQTRSERESAYPRDDAECMPEWHFAGAAMSGLEPMTNRDGLSNAYTDRLYEYAPRPTCRRQSSECGSEFLFCDTVTDPARPKCTARVRAGGRCDGFEWARDVCHAPGQRCRAGRCIPRDDAQDHEGPEGAGPEAASAPEETLRRARQFDGGAPLAGWRKFMR